MKTEGLSKKLLSFFVLFCVKYISYSQGLTPMPIPCTEPKIYTPGFAPATHPVLDIQGYNCVDMFGPLPYGGPNVIDRGYTDVVGGKYVRFGPGTHVGGFTHHDSLPLGVDPYYAHAYIGQNDFEVVWFEPNDTPGEVGQYEKLELGVKLPSPIDSMVYSFLHPPGTTEWLNPFDPAAVNVEAEFYFLGENYSLNAYDFTKKVYGFYYKEYFVPEESDSSWVEDSTSYPFRIRFAPTAMGNWVVKIKIETPIGDYEVLPIYFKCVTSDNLGYVKVGQPNKNFFQLGGNTFYPLGHNLHWAEPDEAHYIWEDVLYNRGITFPRAFLRYRELMTEYKNAGANAFRLIISPWTYEIEFEELGNYGKRMVQAWELDNVIELAEELGLKIELNLQLHYAFENPTTYGFTNWDWKYHSCPTNDAAYAYSTDLGLNVEQFFDTTLAKNHYKNRLRYILSRLNYSTSIMGYELISEINNVGKISNYVISGSDCGPDGQTYSAPYHESSSFATTAKDWLLEMAGFIKNDLGYTEHLLSTCYAGTPFDKPPGVVMTGAMQHSVYSLGDNSIMNDLFDIGSFNAYELSVSQMKNSLSKALDYSYGFNIADVDEDFDEHDDIGKPLIHSEFGNGDKIIFKCDNDVEFIKQVYISPFTGLAAAFNWTNKFRDDLYHHYGNIATFLNPELSFYNISANYWKPSYYTINVADENEVPQVEVYCLENGLTGINSAFGIVVNRTYNGVSEYNSNMSIHTIECDTFMPTIPIENFPLALRTKVSVADIDGAHKLNLEHYDPDDYQVAWYHPFNGSLIKLDNVDVSFLTDNSLELDFPDLNLTEDANSDGIIDDTFLPFVFFKAYQTGTRSLNITQLIADSFSIQKSSDCRVFPSPTNHFDPINIQCKKAIRNVQLISSNGTLLHDFEGNKTILDLPVLQRGVYQLKIIFEDENEEYHKIIVLE